MSSNTPTGNLELPKPFKYLMSKEVEAIYIGDRADHIAQERGAQFATWIRKYKLENMDSEEECATLKCGCYVTATTCKGCLELHAYTTLPAQDPLRNQMNHTICKCKHANNWLDIIKEEMSPIGNTYVKMPETPGNPVKVEKKEEPKATQPTDLATEIRQMISEKGFTIPSDMKLHDVQKCGICGLFIDNVKSMADAEWNERRVAMMDVSKVCACALDEFRTKFNAVNSTDNVETLMPTIHHDNVDPDIQSVDLTNIHNQPQDGDSASETDEEEAVDEEEENKESMQATILAMSEMLKKYKQDLTCCTVERDTAFAEIRKLNGQVLDLENAKRKDDSKFNAEITTLRGMLVDASKQKQAFIDLEQKYTDLFQEKSRLEVRLDNEKQKFTSEIEKVQRKNATLAAQVAQLSQEKTAAQHAIPSNDNLLNAALTSCQEEVQRLTQLLQKKDQENVDLTNTAATALKNKDAEIAGLNVQLAAAIKDFTDLQSQYKGDMHAKDVKLTEQYAKAGTLKAEIKQLKQELKDAKVAPVAPVAAAVPIVSIDADEEKLHRMIAGLSATVRVAGGRISVTYTNQ